MLGIDQVFYTADSEEAACFSCGFWNKVRKHDVPIAMEATKAAGSAADRLQHPAPERVQ
jgi:hypothetical protein